jgi:hypothetical protein
MADRWYYAHGEDRKGPFSGQQMKDLASRGEILPTDTVWKEGVAQGALAGKVKNLFQPAHPPPAGAAPAPAPAAALAEALPPPVQPDSSVLAAETKAGRAEAPPAGGAETASEGATAAARRPAAEQPRAKKGRAVAGKGAILQGQDGVNVRFRKKCTECGHEESALTTMPIRQGIMRSPFYCRKCRKSRDVEIQGYLH